MKEWYFRIATGVGITLALIALWAQLGGRLGLPMFSMERHAERDTRAVAVSQPGDFRWERALARGKTIEIKGVNGSVEAERARGREVEVLAVKQARRSDPNSVRVEAVEHANGVTICAVYPGRENACAPGEGGRMNVRNNDTQVRFTVRVPEGVRLVARTVNGSVKAMSLASDLEAITVNGSIDIVTTGLAAARTVNGSIKAEIGGASLVDDLEFSTVNGSITVLVPDGLDAEVGASTVGGRLATEFPLTVNRRRMHGVLGSGGPELNLSTVNGSIQLKRAR